MLGHVYQELLQVSEDVRGDIASDPEKRTLHFRTLEQMKTEPERTVQIGKLASYWRQHQTFSVLKGWRDEPWPVFGRDDKTVLFSMERQAIGLLGGMRYGVHMTAYVRGAHLRESKYDYGLWVAKRAATKSTYPGALDNTVAGGLSTADGADTFECMVREANEEASFTEEVMRERAKDVGTISYIYVTDERSGMADLLYPEVQWVFDLELPPDGSVLPKPKDGEAESFTLCSVEEVQEQLAQGLFKPNCAVICELSLP
jgi:8-oxo-dGTP pyrophosphatase MutT (NUDIX family)